MTATKLWSHTHIDDDEEHWNAVIFQKKNQNKLSYNMQRFYEEGAFVKFLY